MIRTVVLSFTASFALVAVVIFIFHFGFQSKLVEGFGSENGVDSRQVFRTLFEQCEAYVEDVADFDKTDLLPGSIRAREIGRTIDPENSMVWHHSQSLFQVDLREDVGARSTRRLCDVGLSGYGERPPVSVIGEVIFEFIKIKNERLRTDDYLDYRPEYYSLDTIGFRTREVDEIGCAVIYQLLIDTDGESFSSWAFQQGVACSLEDDG